MNRQLLAFPLSRRPGDERRLRCATKLLRLPDLRFAPVPGGRLRKGLCGKYLPRDEPRLGCGPVCGPRHPGARIRGPGRRTHGSARFRRPAPPLRLATRTTGGGPARAFPSGHVYCPTSQCPPLSGPTRRRTPCPLSLVMFSSTLRWEIPTISESLLADMAGSAFMASTIFR